MAPQKIFEFVILKLTFLSYIHPQYPRMSLTRKRHSPSGYTAQVRDWFNRIISKEKSKIPSYLSVRYCEWNITSGNADLFTIHDYRFDKILLILGEESMYWVYYQNLPMHRRLEGCRRLPVKYCSCCLSKQYLNILQIVKRCTMKTSGLN